MKTTSNEKGLAALCHLSGFLGAYLIPIIGGICLPWLATVIWKDSEFIKKHGRESANFQLNYLIYLILTIPLTLLTLFLFAMLFDGTKATEIFMGLSVVIVPSALIIVALFELICVIIATIASAMGGNFNYPVIIKSFQIKR